MDVFRVLSNGTLRRRITQTYCTQKVITVISDVIDDFCTSAPWDE